MTAKEVLDELRALGTEKTAATYRRHRAGEKLFGVSYGDMGKIAKRIKTDHKLANELWQSGYMEAQVIAAMTADPQQATVTSLKQWLKSTEHLPALDAFVNHYASVSPHGPKLAEEWSKSKDEWTGRAGWTLAGALATKDADLPDSWFKPIIETIRQEIHQRPNLTREAMNWALIAIGTRNTTLQKTALAAAADIGTVYVDQGDTECKTPDAAQYILKTAQRKKAKAASA